MFELARERFERGAMLAVADDHQPRVGEIALDERERSQHVFEAAAFRQLADRDEQQFVGVDAVALADVGAVRRRTGDDRAAAA